MTAPVEGSSGFGAADVDQAVHQALAHHEAGRLDEAERGYQSVLAVRPDHPDALHLLALVHQRQGRLDEAIELTQRAIAALPGFGPFWGTLGALLMERGDLAGSISAYRNAIARPPELPDTYNNFGNALLKGGEVAEAAGAYRRAIALRGDFPEAYNNLANALARLGAGELSEAEDFARKAIELRPGDSRFWLRLSDVLLRGRGSRYDEALAAAQRAVDLESGSPSRDPRGLSLALTRLGDVLHRMHRTQEALQAYERAIATDPQATDARCSAAGVLWVQGFVADSISLYRAALQIRPDMIACHSNLLWALHSDLRCGPAELLEEHVRWANRHAPRSTQRPDDNDRSPDRRLRIGYVSGDFREHSVARFFLPLLENHDKEQVEVFCYSTITRPDAITQRIRSAADHWREVDAASDEQLVGQIRADRIDVLIDLAGHTSGNRLTAFAHKPAPVQCSWLGWLGTTGLSQMDYWIADELTVPQGQDDFFAERVYRLRPPFLCYGPPEDSPPVAEPPALRNGYITFGSFNNLGKLSPELLDCWAKILHSVQNARLLLKAVVLADGLTRNKVQHLLAQHGAPIDRVQLLPPEPETSRHLAAYGQMDIALDTWPFNGATTTAEALWMGVPVITMARQTHVSRVGLSLVSSVGLNELCTHDVDSYIAAAVKLGNDVDRIKTLRQSMRHRVETSPLMDGRGFARVMEEACRKMVMDDER